MDLLPDEGNRLANAHIAKIDRRNVDFPENGLETWSAPLSSCDRAKVISRRRISLDQPPRGIRKATSPLRSRPPEMRAEPPIESLPVAQRDLKTRRAAARPAFSRATLHGGSVHFNSPSDLNKAGHLFSVRGEMRRRLVLGLILLAAVSAHPPSLRGQLSEEQKKKLFLKAREDIQPVPKPTVTPRPKPKAAPTPTPAPRVTPTSPPRATPTSDAARNAKAGAGTQRDTAPDAESNARAARKTAAEAPRLSSRVSCT